MPEKNIPTTSVFATENTNADEVKALIAQGLEHMKPNGKIEWSELDTPIGYSRGWLIVRRAQLEVNEPSALVKLPTHADKDREFRMQSDVIINMREVQKLSWGDIAVRVGLPESRVRALYRRNGVKKDLGLRIGKGGRFAYGDPTLYLENRKVEGAEIPVDLKGRPIPEMLLNFHAKEQAATGGDTKSQRSQAWAKGKVTKLLRLLNDPATPDAQKPAIEEKIAELRAKYNLAA